MAIRVLIVDDTDHVRNMLSHMLTLDGFEVVGAAGGASEAIGSLGLTEPDIVIMGNPASDDWFQQSSPQRQRIAAGRQILYFAFGEFSYVFDTRYLRDKNEVWRALLTDIHETLQEHLRGHPNDALLYKRGAKGNRDYWQGSERLLALENAHLIPSTANANASLLHSIQPRRMSHFHVT